MDSEASKEATASRPRARWDFLTVVLCATCIALTVLVFLLARQNRQLKALLAAPPGLPAGVEALAAGDVVAPFDANAQPSGEATHVAFGHGVPNTLLLVFSPDCPACIETMPAWNRVLVDPLPGAVRVLGLKTGPGMHEGAAAPAFPVLELTGPFDKVPFVPATVLVNGAGTVQQVWFGALNSTQEAELREALEHAASSS